MAQLEVCKDARHREPTFICALWSRRFPRCPVCSDLPSPEPLTAHLLNRVLRVLSTGAGEKKNSLLALVPSAKRVTSPRAKRNPTPHGAMWMGPTMLPGLTGRISDPLDTHRMYLLSVTFWTWLIWLSLALETLQPESSVPLERK